jgi:hypothetical protein
MKKLLVVLLMLLMASSSWAAGTIIVETDKMYVGLSGQYETREITYLVTFGADHTSPPSTALDSILKANGNPASTVNGWWLFKVNTQFGSTGPTDNTDLDIYRATGSSKTDILGGNGENCIDNATNNSIYPATSTQPLFGDDILVITSNLVNSAITRIVLELYR